jgi:hypothetical protein
MGVLPIRKDYDFTTCSRFTCGTFLGANLTTSTNSIASRHGSSRPFTELLISTSSQIYYWMGCKGILIGYQVLRRVSLPDFIAEGEQTTNRLTVFIPDRSLVTQYRTLLSWRIHG